ncbi:hypothetical protein HELRODRAFT_170176 [Helobdella robusta]|uniref:Uncharacterized protein n=1 Tax=Helobdella robusta TaxID=6412 RepID=T1F2R1_HELRO|nr:hypothetical protein HELRODRAFT_170176 [Helobdella robusta]ESO07649.1 hypothetical protein HELRODRAFT_170176 [Helobdella robusta]
MDAVVIKIEEILADRQANTWKASLHKAINNPEYIMCTLTRQTLAGSAPAFMNHLAIAPAVGVFIEHMLKMQAGATTSTTISGLDKFETKRVSALHGGAREAACTCTYNTSGSLHMNIEHVDACAKSTLAKLICNASSHLNNHAISSSTSKQLLTVGINWKVDEAFVTLNAACFYVEAILKRMPNREISEEDFFMRIICYRKT